MANQADQAGHDQRAFARLLGIGAASQAFNDNEPALSFNYLNSFKRPVIPQIIARTHVVERKVQERGRLVVQPVSFTTYALWDIQGRLIELPSAFLYHHGQAYPAKESTRRTYAYCLSRVCQILDRTMREARDNPHLDYFPPCATVDDALLAMDPEILRDIFDNLKAAGLNADSRLKHEAALKGFYLYLTSPFADYDGPYLEAIPWEKNSKGGYKSLVGSVAAGREPIHIEAEELILLLRHLPNEPLRAAAQFLYESDLRLDEFLNFTLGDLYRGNAHLILGTNKQPLPADINYYAFKVRGGKSRQVDGEPKERKTFICKPLLNRLIAYHTSIPYRIARGYLLLRDERLNEKPAFLTADGKPFTAKTLRYWLEKARIAAGIRPHRIMPKAFRSSAAQNVLRSNIGKSLTERLLVAQAALGHANVETTRKAYVSVAELLLNADQELVDLPQQSQAIWDQTKM